MIWHYLPQGYPAALAVLTAGALIYLVRLAVRKPKPPRSQTASKSARLFDEAKPIQDGNLYERTKFLMKSMERRMRDYSGKPDPEFDRLYREIKTGIDALRDEPDLKV